MMHKKFIAALIAPKRGNLQGNTMSWPNQIRFIQNKIIKAFAVMTNEKSIKSKINSKEFNYRCSTGICVIL